VTGILHEGSPDRPALLPGAACDYTTGYLAAYGTLLALARRAREAAAGTCASHFANPAC